MKTLLSKFSSNAFCNRISVTPNQNNIFIVILNEMYICYYLPVQLAEFSDNKY